MQFLFPFGICKRLFNFLKEHSDTPAHMYACLSWLQFVWHLLFRSDTRTHVCSHNVRVSPIVFLNSFSLPAPPKAAPPPAR